MKETGACPFCGQEVMVQVPETASEEEASYAAAMNCDCLNAHTFRRKEQAKKEGQESIEDVLNQDEQGKRIGCRVIPVAKELIPAIVEGDIRSVTVSITPEISIKLKWNEKAAKVDVERKETLTTKA